MIASKALSAVTGAILSFLVASSAQAAETSPAKPGYYRAPAIHGETIVFTAEGDLWSVSIQGGEAHRLTSNPGTEIGAMISPDGQTVAFAAEYEGPREVYTIPIAGGMPQRRTWDGDAIAEGWTPDGRLMVRTMRYSTLPDPKLALLDDKGGHEVVPLAGAAQGAYAADGRTLFFTRWDHQWSSTKRYQGGWAENLWRFDGKGEAVALTADWAGTSHNPMFWNGRVYFLSDRDGVMNVYSMDEQGHDLKQESHQHVFDVDYATVSDGRIAYGCAGDIWLLDLKTGHDAVVPISLVSDFDQLRDHWVKKPMDYLTAVHLSPDGASAVFTARGEIFTLPAKTGRVVRVAGNSTVRYREARFMPDGKSILAISTESGETEFWKYPANGIGAAEQWTNDSKVMPIEGVPSPDGRWMANHDRDQKLWIYDIKAKKQKLIGQSMNGDFDQLSWSPDSRWLAYVENANNQYTQIKVLNLESGAIETITSDRYDSFYPVWSSDGKWLYFLSDRTLKTTVSSPWGARQPDPHFDHSLKIYELALTPGLRSPFLPADELHPDQPEKKDEKKDEKSKDEKAGDDKKKDDAAKPEDKKPPEVKIDFTDLASRLSEVPVPAGDYDSLQATEKRLCWMSSDEHDREKGALQCLEIANKGDEVETVLPGVKGYEISLDRKKMLVRRSEDFVVLDSDVKASALTDAKVLPKATINLSRWSFSTDPRAEYRGIFLDAWRMERDYFYDRHMNGVDWAAMRDRYLPLVDRVSDRDELNDILAQMFGELSALHTFVEGGDARKPADQIDLAGLGAQLRRDEKAGGYVVEHIYAHDPDLPNLAPPLARPESLVREGEAIVSIDGQSLLGVSDERSLLRGKAGTQVLLVVKSASGETRSVLVTPVKASDERNLAYTDWEYSRRLKVESASNDSVGYVHLRAMGPDDMAQWEREFYPVFNRQGLIIDVRHNHGGNIDSWLLAKLLRQAWFYWQPRVGNPQWNMPYAFRGHIVVLCDQETASDGEAFAEGFRRLKIGPVIGIRTWGGEIWLSGDNTQADNGIASAAETGVYGPEGKWLIEGHGVDPDITVDNLPNATFAGSDAQLQAALNLLKEEIQKDPRPVPSAPPYPNKAFQSTK
jgi:tricorn protease